MTYEHATITDPRSDIEAGNRQFMEAFRRDDAAAVAKLHSATGRLLLAHSDFMDGTAAIQRFWQRAMGMGIKEAIWRRRK